MSTKPKKQKVVNKDNIGKEAILKVLVLMRSRTPMDYFNVRIVGIWENDSYIIVADRIDRQFIVKAKYLKIYE